MAEIITMYNPDTKKYYQRVKCVNCENHEPAFWMRDGLCSNCQVQEFKLQVMQEIEAMEGGCSCQ